MKAGFASAGQDCGPTKPGFAYCAAGGQCDNSPGSTGSCQAPAADGQSCDTANAVMCLPGAECVGDANGASVTGTCTVRTAALCD